MIKGDNVWGEHFGQYLAPSRQSLASFPSLASAASLLSELELSAKQSAGGAPQVFACFPETIPGRVAGALGAFIPFKYRLEFVLLKKGHDVD